MINTIETLPFNTFENALRYSSVLDSGLGIYKRIYYIWRWSSLVPKEEDMLINASLIGTGIFVSVAVRILGGEKIYSSIAQKIAITYYTLETIEHLCKTWKDISQLIQAFQQNQGGHVIPNVALPEWALPFIDRETGEWILTKMILMAIKVKTIASILLVVIYDLLLVPYHMWRVRDAYNPKNNIEKNLYNALTFYHAKLLIQKTSAFQNIAEEYREKVKNLFKCIVGSGAIELNEVAGTAKTILNESNKESTPIFDKEKIKNDLGFVIDGFNYGYNKLNKLFATKIEDSSSIQKRSWAVVNAPAPCKVSRKLFDKSPILNITK